MLSLSGHLGPKASALVDGQLSPAEEERAWSHVLSCPGCRQLVEQEGWTKRRLGSLAATSGSEDPPQELVGSLCAVDAWSEVAQIERHSARRRTAAVVVGGGAVGAAVLSLITVTGAPVTRDVPSRIAPATVRGDLLRSQLAELGPRPRPRAPRVGSSTGAENAVAVWTRRSR